MQEDYTNSWESVDVYFEEDEDFVDFVVDEEKLDNEDLWLWLWGMWSDSRESTLVELQNDHLLHHLNSNCHRRVVFVLLSSSVSITPRIVATVFFSSIWNCIQFVSFFD